MDLSKAYDYLPHIDSIELLNDYWIFNKKRTSVGGSYSSGCEISREFYRVP